MHILLQECSPSQSLPRMTAEKTVQKNTELVTGCFFFNAVSLELGLFWRKKSSKQIYYFYTIFTRIKLSARLLWDTNRHEHYFKENLFPLQEVMSCYILGAVWVENLFWKASRGVDVCLETWQSFPWSGARQHCSPLPGEMPRCPPQPPAERVPAWQKMAGLFCDCTQVLSILCPASV